MKKSLDSTTLRLFYPQWQGGVVSNWMPDIPAEDSSKGYYLGAQILKLLAPQGNQKTVEVPVSTDIKSHALENGISGYRAIVQQTKSALELLDKENPERIVTLGGECSVSVVPFTWLAARYPGDVAVVWIDAHPDVNLPYDSYSGYHAMALTACMGKGDSEIVGYLPSKIDSSKCLLVGLRSWDEGMQERQSDLGVHSLSALDLRADSGSVLRWLSTTGASRVVIHFDLDVLDPSEMVAGVSADSNGMLLHEVVNLMNEIAEHYDVVGISIAEFMPRIAIKLKGMLESIPLLQE